MPIQRMMIPGCLAFLLALAGCGQQEMEKLKAENRALADKVQALEQENAKLKETDQSYFNRGVDALKGADTKATLQSASDIFGQLVEKFPQSPYLPKAQEHIADIQKKIANADKIANEGKQRKKLDTLVQVLRETTVTSGAQMFENVELQDDQLNLYVSASLAGAIINANLKFFADTSKELAGLCGCAGQVNVGIDTTFLGGQKQIVLRFRNGVLSGGY